MNQYHYRKLRGKIVEIYGSQAAFSKAIGLTQNTLSMKLNGKVDLSKRDMLLWGDLLEIPLEEYPNYFFT